MEKSFKMMLRITLDQSNSRVLKINQSAAEFKSSMKIFPSQTTDYYRISLVINAVGLKARNFKIDPEAKHSGRSLF